VASARPRRPSLIVVAAATALVAAGTGHAQVPAPPRASAAPALSGRYLLVLSPGRTLLPMSPSCSTLPSPLSILVDVGEGTNGTATEVRGQSAASAEPPDDARFVLLRQSDKVHGAMGCRNDFVGLRTVEGYRVWMQIMTDGTAAATSGGRSRASGTAFGEIDVSRPGDADTDSIGYCMALDHQWSLEPQ
jgi:hypothetical protein